MSGERWHVASSAAEIYDEFLVPAVFGPWAGILVEAAGVGAGGRLENKRVTGVVKAAYDTAASKSHADS